MAFRTESGQFEHMVLDDEAGRILELIDERLEVLGAGKLDDMLAAFADQVVAVVVFSERVAVTAVVGMNPTSDIQLG